MSNKHRWVRIFGSLLALVLALGVGLIPVAAQRPAAAPQATYPFFEETAIAKAISYLHTQQLPSGGIDAYTYGADPGGTSRLLLALNVVGAPPATFVNTGKSLLDYLGSEIVGYIYANDTPDPANLFPGRAGLLLGGVAAGGGDPRAFGGVDLVAALNAAYNAGDGTYSTSASEAYSSGAASDINQAFSILGLVAAGQPIPAKATQWLIDEQDAAGSWSGSGDVTGYVVVALLGSGNVAPTNSAIQKAVAFYRTTQTKKTALWGNASGSEPANSTGWALTALSAAGYTPPTVSWATGGTSPRAALIGLQTTAGAIGSQYVNAYSTIEALYGLSDQPLFFAPPLRAERALAYLGTLQNADGGWPSFGSNSSPGETIDDLLAFVAAGYAPSGVKSSAGKTPLDYLAGAAATYTRDDSNLIFPAQTGKLIVGVVAAGGNPSAFGTPTHNLVSDLESTIRATGAYSSTAVRGYTSGAADVTTQSFAILGLRAAGRTVPQAAITYLTGLQGADGGWGSPDSTGLALQALIAAGVAPSAQAVVDGVAYLQTSQAAGGGWESYGTPNANSIAYAIQGLLAARVDLNASSWLKNGRSPIGTLASYQKSDGPFVYSWEGSYGPGADNLYATQQAVPALLGATYPYTATAPGNLRSSYTPLPRGSDPDRLVAGSPTITFNANRTQATLTAPFGSDLNGDATATLAWIIELSTAQTEAFQPITATRGDGAFQATLDLSKTPLGPSDTLVLRATFTDAADGVQSGGTISTAPVTLTAEATPYRQYLPLVRR